MKLRHEIKHYINVSDYLTIKNRLKHIASLDSNADENGEYRIRSVYFDDYNDKVLTEKLIGLNYRDKFRIRIYNNNNDLIRLEKKSKINGLCMKMMSILTVEEYTKILKGDIDFLKNSFNPLYNELYVRMNSERWKPKTVVDYIREAYVYSVGNVRITFDKSVRTGLTGIDILENELATIETIDPSYIILEVKYDEFMPDIISDIIQIGERSKTAVSKYALCRMYG